jgi:2-polyprenyl-3-methyl-5-hydroxy-6-metoxy-1,4-benzoquinol methylase
MKGEHHFWNPASPSELAWFYSHSVNYLFANSVHPAEDVIDKFLNRQHAPVLDYSGGVGNNVLSLAQKGIRAEYFGIGMIEAAFARYRVARRGLQGLVEFNLPYSDETEWKMDPIRSVLRRDGRFGAILAIDVLEHIPHYERVVSAMVDSIRVGGVIIERSPFGENEKGVEPGLDLRVHVGNGGVDMRVAMGPRMVMTSRIGMTVIWTKVSQ